MAGRRRKPDHLSETQIEQFMADAERLHATICLPLISPQCGHYRALQSLNEAISGAIVQITGREPPWLFSSSSGTARREP